MQQTIVITGATGLIGKALAALLVQGGCVVRSLSRSAEAHPVEGVQTYLWDPTAGQMDMAALEGADALIHLAGASIADETWTDERKQEILESRTKSARLLGQGMAELAGQGRLTIKRLVSASAIGYYGVGTKPFSEMSGAGKDFPAKVCIAWEQAARQMCQPGQTLVILRVGIVLAREGGAYPKLLAPVRWGLGTHIGTGAQMMSWVHIRDIIGLFAHAATTTEMEGVYNGVSREPVSQQFFIFKIGKYLHRFTWPIGVPAFIMRTVLGERATLVLDGATVISARLPMLTGYKLRYPQFYEALQDLLGKKRRRRLRDYE